MEVPSTASERERRDPAWIEAQAASEDSRFLPLWNLNVLVKAGDTAELGWARSVVRDIMNPDVGAVLLGLHEGVAHFAVDISSVKEPLEHLGAAGVASLEDVRAAATRLAPEDASIVAHARSRVDWHARHVFCSACGGKTTPERGGSHRYCRDCRAEHFPRTDPVAIAVVTSGSRCLLGRAAGFPVAMYSALAGFIESGESLEEAVRREVMEEAGVKVGRVRYVVSQPWPFASSLMIGCIAEAESEALDIDEVELQEAGWFERETVRRALENPGDSPDLMVPPAMAIAHHLLRAWVAEG